MAMLVSFLFLLVSTGAALAQYESVLCVCQEVSTLHTKGDTEICRFQHGYITRGKEFVAFTGKSKVSITPLENLHVVDNSVCGDDEDKRRIIFTHSTTVDAKGGVTHNFDVDAHVGKIGVSGGVSLGHDKVDMHGSLGLGVGTFGASYEHSSSGHKVGVSAGISDPSGIAGGDVHASYSSGSGLDGGFSVHAAGMKGTFDVKGGPSLTMPGKRHASIYRRANIIQMARKRRLQSKSA